MVMDTPGRLGSIGLSSLGLSVRSNSVRSSLFYIMWNGVYFVGECFATHTEYSILITQASYDFHQCVFRCNLPLFYSAVLLVHLSVDGNWMLCSGMGLLDSNIPQ